MSIPVTMVTIIDVCFGRKPNNDMRRFPTLVPILSPKNAINPPIIAITRSIRNPTNMVLYSPIIWILSSLNINQPQRLID